MTETGAAVGQKTASRRKEKSTIREYAEAIIIALLLALFVRTFIIQAFKIPSGSMENTLLIGDHILVNKFIYWFRDIQRGDVIVFRFPRDESRDFIKRVVGLPGEKVIVHGKRVYINCNTPDQLELCEPLNDSAAIFNPDGQAYGPPDQQRTYSVPPGHYFVLGDNRNNSQDSRFWGFLKAGEQLDYLPLRFGGYAGGLPFPCSLWPAPCWDSKIRGAAFLIYWSWNRSEGNLRWGRLGKWIK